MLLCAGPAYAHTLYMTVVDNDDGTITVAGMYSTGALAANTEVRLVDPNDKVVFKGRTDATGELDITKPETAYRIILDAGPGHIASEQGPR